MRFSMTSRWVTEKLCFNYLCVGITLDGCGNVYLSCGSFGLKKFNARGSTRFEVEEIAYNQHHNFRGIVWDYHNSLYICDYVAHKIVRFDTQTKLFSVVCGTGEQGHQDGNFAQAQFCWPCGIAVDKNGMLYVTDDHHVRMIDIKNQTVETIGGCTTKTEVGFLDGEAKNAQFSDPSGIAVDDNGTIYVCDTGNQCIRQIKDGIVSTIAGTPGVRPGHRRRRFEDLPASLFSNPRGICYCKGYLFVVDDDHYRKIDLKSTIDEEDLDEDEVMKPVSLLTELDYSIEAPSCMVALDLGYFYIGQVWEVARVVDTWAIKKCLWVALYKEDASCCNLARLPKEILKEILKLI